MSTLRRTDPPRLHPTAGVGDLAVASPGVGGNGAGADGGVVGGGDAGGVVAAGDGGAATGGVDAGRLDAGGVAPGGVDAGGGAGGTPSSPFSDTATAIHSFLTFDYRITAAQIPQIAPRTDFVWGADGSNVQAWHAANPKTFVSYYIPSNQDPNANSLSYWQANHPDWVLYQCDRKTPATAPGYPNIDLDVSNPAVQAWQLGMIKSAATQGYDGIAFDLFALANYRGACGIFRNGQWVQLYTGAVHDAKYTADLLAWLHATYTAMHALPRPLYLVPNYVLDVDPASPEAAQLIANVDGVLDEEAFGNYGSYTTDASWLLRVQFLDKLQQAGKEALPVGGFTTVDKNAIEWSLATYLMFKEHHAALYVAGSSGAQYGMDDYHAEYAAAVGNACGAMTAAQGGYTRTFQHAQAIVNPSSTATVKFMLPPGATDHDLYGTAVSGSVTLAPHSGIVLLTAGAPSC